MIPYLLVTVAAIAGSFFSARHRSFSSARHRSSSLTAYGPLRAVGDRLRQSSWTYFDLAVVALLIAFSGLRFHIGTDYDAYSRVYGRVEVQDLSRLVSAPLEVGYTALMVVLKVFTPSPLAFFWAAAAITVLPAYAAIKKFSKNLPFSVALYMLLAFYFAPMNIVRQGIAISLVFWASTYLGASWKKFLAISIIAVTFHSSAMFAAVGCLLFFMWKPTRKQMLLLVAIATLFILWVSRLSIVAQLLSAINPRYGGYAQGAGTGLGAYLMIAMNIGLLVYAMRVGPSTPENPAQDAWMFALILTGIAFMVIGTQAVNVSRMGMYFTIYLIVLLPNRVNQAARPLAHMAILGAGAAIYAYMYLSSYGGLLNYQTYL